MRNIQIPNEKKESINPGLILNNQILQVIFEESQEAVFILKSDDFKILECNKKAVELFQADNKKQLIELPSFRLYDSEPIEFSKRLLEAAIKNGNSHTQELAFRTLKNNVFWGKLTKKPVNSDNKSLVILKVSKVIDYIRSEDTLSTLLHGTSKVTGRLFFRELTKLLCRTFGTKYAFIAKFKDDEKTMLQTVISWGNNEETKNYTFDYHGGPCENILNGYTSFYPKDLASLFPDDNLIKELNIVSFIGAPIFTFIDNPVGVLVLMDDKPMDEIPNARYILSVFASRAGAELQRLKSRGLLREQATELAKANASKDQFLSVLSNDLKNPFNVIMGFTELILKNSEIYNKEKIINKVEILNNSIRNIYSLLENLTDWSKFQINKITFEPKPFDINKIILENMVLFSYIFQLKKIDFINNIKPGSIVYGDETLLKTVTRNLLSNAVKYTFSHGKIEVSLVQKAKHTEFIIKDDGTGMSTEDLEAVFYTPHKHIKAGTGNEKGPGIGLMLCKEFIHLHNGEIKIESTPGKGTSVRIILPKQ